MAKGRKTGGRQAGTPNKATAEVKEMARQHTPAMIGELARIALNSESDAARVAAIRELLDRGHGKVSQPIGGDGEGGPIIVEIRQFGGED